MLLQDPFSTVAPTIDGAILHVLAGAHSPFTVANIHALRPDASISGIRRALPRLVRQGIVTEQRFDRAVAFSFNHNHLAAEGILALANIRDTFIQRLRHTIRDWEHRPLLAARGDMHEDSDIDILVVSNPNIRAAGFDEHRPASPDLLWGSQTTSLADQVTDWTGNPCQIIEMDCLEFDTKVDGEDALLRNIREDGVILYGDRKQLIG
jgi:hypothetical protein